MKKLIILIIVLFGSITVFPQAEMKTYRLPNKTVAFSIPHGVGTEIFLMDSLKSYILNHSVTVAQTMNTVFTNSWYDLPSNSMSMDSSNINRLYFDSASGTMLTVTGTLAGATLNTGQGANELYDMDQNVLTTSTVTFIGTDGGTMTATTLNTGQGANELYDMDQNVLTISDVLFLGVSVGTLTVTSTFSTPTINTGQGDNEVYAMDQDVETTSDVTFGTMTATVSVLLPDAGIIKIGEQQISRNNSIYLELNNGIIVDGYTLAKDETFFQDLAKFDSNLMIEKKYDVAPYYLNFALKDTIGIESKVKLQNLSDISLQNKAGTGQIEIIERDTIFTSEVVANLSNIGTITVYDSVTTWKGIKSFEEYAEMADGGTMTLTASTAGVIEIYGETSGVGDTIYASAHFSSDAAVSKHLDCTLNVADTDVASKFCIYDSGSAVVIKNALGRNGQFYIRVKYFTPSFP